MPLRTHFVVCTSLLIAATSPVSAEVAYISDAGNNRSIVDVFQTSTLYAISIATHKITHSVGLNWVPPRSL